MIRICLKPSVYFSTAPCLTRWRYFSSEGMTQHQNQNQTQNQTQHQTQNQNQTQTQTQTQDHNQDPVADPEPICCGNGCANCVLLGDSLGGPQPDDAVALGMDAFLAFEQSRRRPPSSSSSSSSS